MLPCLSTLSQADIQILMSELRCCCVCVWELRAAGDVHASHRYLEETIIRLKRRAVPPKTLGLFNTRYFRKLFIVDDCCIEELR